MKERIWLSNYSLDDIRGGTEIVGTQYCRAMKLKYFSAGKVGVVFEDLDKFVNRRDMELIVYNSTNGYEEKFNANKSITVCCENFKTESESLNDKQFRDFKMLQWSRQIKSLNNADKIITLSRGEQKAFEEDGFKSTVIEPYVDLDAFYPKKVVTPPKVQALFVGRKHMRKGYDIILELEKLFPEINFIKVVDGNLSTEELNNLYNEVTFLIMPSRYESFGFIYAEALATNLPIISSRVGMFKDWQPDEYGIFPKDITVEAFEDAIAHEFSRHNFKKSRDLAYKRFSYDRFRRDCDDLLNNW